MLGPASARSGAAARRDHGIRAKAVSRRSATRAKRPGRKWCGRSRNPIKTEGGLAILHGSLAPEGCVVKLAGHERVLHSGPARVFDSEEAAFDSGAEPQDSAGRRGGDSLRRAEGRPRNARNAGGDWRAGWPRNLGENIALITDGRFSGATHGLMVGSRGAGSGERRTDRVVARWRHDYARCARAAAGRAANLEERRAQWKAPAPHYTSGVMAKYAKLGFIGIAWRRDQRRIEIHGHEVQGE